MKHICYVIVCMLFISCKQGIFLKRKYTNGLFFSKVGSVHLKEIHQAKTKITAPTFSEQADVVIVVSEPLTDTIILNSGRKVPCKVKTIQRKTTTYTDGQSGPTAINKSIRNKNVARIHFKEGQKEYFTQRDHNGNPLLQFDFIRNSKQPRTGLAILGYTFLVIISLGLIMASIFVGFFFLILALTGFVCLSSNNYETLGFKIVHGFGKFMGVLLLVGLGIALAALLIVIAAFA